MLIRNVLKFFYVSSFVTADQSFGISDDRKQIAYIGVIELIKAHAKTIYSECKVNLSKEVLSKRALALDKQHIHIRIHGYPYLIKLPNVILKMSDLYCKFKNYLPKRMAQPLYSAHFGLFISESTSLLVKDSPSDFLIAFGTFFDSFIERVLNYYLYSYSQEIGVENPVAKILYKVLEAISIRNDIEVVCKKNVNCPLDDVLKRIEIIFEDKLKWLQETSSIYL
ncbi:hypothetical protein GINT2_002265 [Glugoides intestinalis]